MFKKLQSLNSQTHKNLKFSPIQPYHFAAAQVLIPVSAAEAFMAAREYVLVFGNESQDQLFAITGLQPGKNDYVASSGHWLGRYVPSHIRRYPFIFAESPRQEQQSDSERQYVIQFDSEAPHLQQEDGEALFDEQGKDTAMMERIKNILINVQQNFDRTAFLVDQIYQTGILKTDSLTVQSDGAEPKQVTGFRTVDLEKFHALSGEQLAALRETGALAMIYAHLLSLSNLHDSVLATASSQSTEAYKGGNDTLSFEGIDWSKFDS